MRKPKPLKSATDEELASDLLRLAESILKEITWSNMILLKVSEAPPRNEVNQSDGARQRRLSTRS
jgi:hypothetical protein